jgi:hypothetical protein
MKNLPTYDKWINEEKMNEFLKIDMKKVENFLADLKTKIKDSSTVNSIQRFVRMNTLDPYSNFNEIISLLSAQYSKNREVMAVIKNHAV